MPTDGDTSDYGHSNAEADSYAETNDKVHADEYNAGHIYVHTDSEKEARGWQTMKQQGTQV